MNKLVIISFGQGSFEAGFPNLAVRLGTQGNLHTQLTGNLPPAPEITQLYHNWQLIYNSCQRENRGRIEVEQVGVTNISLSDFNLISKQLGLRLNQWLNKSGFQNIARQLRTQLNTSDTIQVIIESAHPDVWRIPWLLWDFFQDYPQAEVALSTPEYPSPPAYFSSLKNKVKILAILGDSRGIDIQQDWQLLKKLPQVDLHTLVEPTRRELNEQLWQTGWDILFFGGHSATVADGTKGRIYINSQEQENSLTIEELKEALSYAVSRGLKLAIFNSCDGLGLPRDLANQGIPLPPSIVMREPVPDPVAQAFLQYFFRAFTDGEPFPVAVRQAREQLKGLEGAFPQASWLPVICQHPAISPPSWEEITGINTLSTKDKFYFLNKNFSLRKTIIFAASLVILYFIFGPALAKETNKIGLYYYQKEKNFDLAYKIYKTSTLLDNNNSQAYYNLGWICDNNFDNLDCALKYHEKAAKRGYAEAFAEFARLSIKTDNLSSVLKGVWQCLEITDYDPVKAACLKNRAWLRLEQGRLEEAEKDLQQAINLIDDSPHSHCLLAQVWELQGKKTQSLSAWKKVKQYASYEVPEEDECIAEANQRLTREK